MLNFVNFVVEIKPCFGAGSPDSFLRKPRRFLRCPFCLGLVQFLPSLSQLFPGVFRFCLCFLVLVLFAPGLLGGALRLLCLAGILRRPRPLKIPFVRFLSDDVSLLSKPRAIMARSVLCPVHFLFFVLRAGGHNGVQLGILREAVNKRDGGVPEEQQPFAGIGMGHIGKLVGADPKLFG